MKPLKILIETLVDEGLPNAQMSNAREIIVRLNPELFSVTAFHQGRPDPRIAARPSTRLIPLSDHRQTLTILRQFLLGDHDLLFYVKASPASKVYMKLRRVRGKRGLTLACVESQTNLRDEPTIEEANIRLIEQTVLRADYLFSNSRFVQRSLESNYGLASEVIPTGVDTKFFVPGQDRPPNPRTTVLFVGSLRPFKGPEFVLDAARQMPDVDFVVVGDGPMATELRSRSAGLPNFRMTGAVDAARVRALYQQADIFLFPSRWEGSPKVLAEAAACGLPAVARADYEPETMVDGQTGLLGRDDAGVFAALHRLVRDPSLRRSMGQAARHHILGFDWDRITRWWEEAFLHSTGWKDRQS